MNVIDRPAAGRPDPRAPGLRRRPRLLLRELTSAERYAEPACPAVRPGQRLRAPRRGVLRGLHYQHPSAQGKLVTRAPGRGLRRRRRHPPRLADLRPVGRRRRSRPTTRASSTSPRASPTASWSPASPPSFAYKCTEVYSPRTTEAHPLGRPRASASTGAPAGRSFPQRIAPRRGSTTSRRTPFRTDPPPKKPTPVGKNRLSGLLTGPSGGG